MLTQGTTGAHVHGGLSNRCRLVVLATDRSPARAVWISAIGKGGSGWTHPHLPFDASASNDPDPHRQLALDPLMLQNEP